MVHRVMCRACRNYFDRDLLVEGIDWVKPSVNQYYHRSCYEEWAMKKGDINANFTNDKWFEALKYYLNHEIKAPIDYRKLTSQWNNFLKQNKTAKGIYFAMRYFYDVEKGDKEKSQGGIGIVSSIYQDSCNYWVEQFNHDNLVLKKIEEQAQTQITRQIKEISQIKKPTNRKKVTSLDNIE